MIYCVYQLLFPFSWDCSCQRSKVMVKFRIIFIISQNDRQIYRQFQHTDRQFQAYELSFTHAHVLSNSSKPASNILLL